jgi:hypothetical protein
LICRWRVRGFLFRSQEDKERWGLPRSQRGWDEAVQLIRWPCEQFLFTIRFYCQPIDYLPRTVHATVTYPDGSRAQNELEHVAMDYAHPLRANGLPGGTRDASHAPQAVLTVHRPQLGFCYGLRWDLHTADQPIELRGIRKRLLQMAEDPDGKSRLQRFLESVGPLVADRLSLREPSKSHVHLFGFDDSRHELKWISGVCQPDDPLRNVSPGWGKDIIGTAFRRNEMVFFSRDELERAETRNERLDQLPSNVRAMMAIPIRWRPPARDTGSTAVGAEDGYPLGIVAMVAYNMHSEFETALVRTPGKKMVDLFATVGELYGSVVASEGDRPAGGAATPSAPPSEFPPRESDPTPERP